LQGINTLASYEKELVLVDRVLDVHVECTATQTRVFIESCKTAETQIQTQYTTTCLLASRMVLRFDRVRAPSVREL